MDKITLIFLQTFQCVHVILFFLVFKCQHFHHIIVLSFFSLENIEIHVYLSLFMGSSVFI